jgi:hypothetical protein
MAKVMVFGKEQWGSCIYFILVLAGRNLVKENHNLSSKEIDCLSAFAVTSSCEVLAPAVVTWLVACEQI